MAWTELSIEKYEGLLALVDVPKFAPVNYEVKRGNIIDPEPAVRATLAERGVLDRIHPGDSVCIGCGSREIHNIDRIAKALVDEVKARGGNPFIIPSMGSHGGATAEGQLEVLASYGITDEQMNNVRQSAFARAYTSNILSIAYGKDILDILVAVLPCAWVYADYGYRLAHEFADTLDVNQYKSWVDMYKTDEFWQGSAWLIEHIEKPRRRGERGT